MRDVGKRRNSRATPSGRKVIQRERKREEKKERKKNVNCGHYIPPAMLKASARTSVGPTKFAHIQLSQLCGWCGMSLLVLPVPVR